MRLFWMRSLQGLSGPAWRGWVLPAYLTTLPGARQRRRALTVWAVTGLVMVLRSAWPLRLLPGWCVGLLLLWAVLELLRWLWWPRRWA